MLNKKRSEFFGKLIIVSILAFGLCACEQEKTLHLQGYIESDLLYINVPYSGKLINRPVNRGHSVTKNQLLFELDKQPEATQLQEAQANLEEAQYNLANLEKGQRQTIIQGYLAKIKQTKADLELTRQRIARSQQLFKKGAISRDALDESISNYNRELATLTETEANLAEAQLGSRTDLISAQVARINAAKAKVNEYQWILSQKTAFSPIDGVVFDSYFDPGEWVNTASSVLSILPYKEIHVRFFVPTADLRYLRLGEKVEFTEENNPQKYSAIIRYISPKAEYTPPVIYSRDSNYKLVFQVRAYPSDPASAVRFHPGEPVMVHVPKEGK